jgi:hypothetical protein
MNITGKFVSHFVEGAVEYQVCERQCSGFEPFMTSHFNTTVSAFHYFPTDYLLDHMAGDFASPTVLLICR